jgi:DprA/Smf-like nucleotide binding protein involved in DNA uptake
MNDPADSLLRISMSHGLPRCLHAVAELGIADALGESPRSAEELARETGTDAGALARTLRVLSAEGIFETRDGAWGHTPASRLLRSDHPHSMRSFVRMIGLPVYWRGFEYFADALRSGQSVQEKVVPGGYWKYLSEHPEAARLFDEAMMGKLPASCGATTFPPFERSQTSAAVAVICSRPCCKPHPELAECCSISRM